MKNLSSFLFSRCIVGLFILLLPNFLFAQWGGGEKYPELKPHQQSLQEWQNMKFGMFVHWGPSVIRGTSSWARGNHPYDFAPRIPINEYDSLYTQFNPVLFDAREWISVAKAAGMKYFIMVTKHHDGFCNWDSPYTDYDIMSTPYKKDILRELSDECHRQGILFGTYYSICDWHHPDYTGRYGGDPRPVESSNMDDYLVFMKNQLDELIDTYQSQIIWFDGYWEGPWTHERGMDLYKYLRDKKDDLLINNRVDRMRSDKEGKTNPAIYAGDYNTPEQEVGAFELDHPWESCITISDGWFYRPQGRLKSLHECISLLVQTVAGGGNLLLNIGPMADGRMELFQKKRLLEMGNWLEKYGETIYGAQGGPFKPGKWVASTRKGNRIFLHVLDWRSETLIIPNIAQQIRKSYLFDGQELSFSKNGDGTLSLTLPKKHRVHPNTIIVLEVDESAEQVQPADPVVFKDLQTIELQNLPSDKYSAEGPETLIDGKRGTLNRYESWLGFESTDLHATVDLHTEKSIGQLKIGYLENQGDWIFAPVSVECSVSSDGKNFIRVAHENIQIVQKGTNLINEIVLDFPAQPARYVKIKVENLGKCPAWHKGAGGKAWLFVDEITVD